jgi:hypothetical protein
MKDSEKEFNWKRSLWWIGAALAIVFLFWLNQPASAGIKDISRDDPICETENIQSNLVFYGYHKDYEITSPEVAQRLLEEMNDSEDDGNKPGDIETLKGTIVKAEVYSHVNRQGMIDWQGVIFWNEECPVYWGWNLGMRGS